MNRIFPRTSAKHAGTPANPLHRPGQQLRHETERALRDMAFVLHLTRKVKEQILDEHKLTSSATF